MFIIAGIDEAGRGPVIGPLIIALFFCDSKNEEKINSLCKKDSKQLSAIKREVIFEQLRTIGKIDFVELSANALNSLMEKETLNEIEAMYIAKLIKNLSNATMMNEQNKSVLGNGLHENIDQTIVQKMASSPCWSVKIDLPDSYSWIFAKRMERHGIEKYEAEHKADEKYPIVAAASICAKVIRDRKIEEIKKDVGDFGSGYPSDEKTISFLKNGENLKKLQPYLRKKWKTLENIKQRKLTFEK